MKTLLRKFGKVIFLDATYKTNPYGFSLFLVVVADAHRRGRIVNAFVLQQEDE